MNNKRIYEDKVKPLSSLFIDYYGNEHQDHINSRFNNLVYNFDDIFTPITDVFDNCPNIVSGLIYGHQNIKNKEAYNTLYSKYLKQMIVCIKEGYGIDVSDKYNLLIDNYFSTKNFLYKLNDSNLSHQLAQDLGIEEWYLRPLYQSVSYYRSLFMESLINTKYFGNLYKRLKCERVVFYATVNAILNREPFLSNYVAKDKSLRQYLYFPHLEYKNCKSNLDTALIHELIHLVESHRDYILETNITGISTGDKNQFVNEVRTDLLAKKLKTKFNGNIFEKRDIEYNTLYLKTARIFTFFFEKYEKLLSDIAITGDLDKLTFYFSPIWDEFSKRMDEIWHYVEKEASLHEDGHTINLNIDVDNMFDLINTMDISAQNKILIK